MSEELSVDGQLDHVMRETRHFPPSKEFAQKARVSSIQQYEELYKQSMEDNENFWAELAREKLHWFKPFTQTLEWREPYAKWFVNGQTNASYNCLDRHIKEGRGDRIALLFEGEPGDRRSITYAQLHKDVCKLANGLKKLGIKAGDRVSIYMPMTPELIVAMLACARIGAVHSVIFGGFSSEAIADRNKDAEAKLQITADGGYRRGKPLALKATVDEALKKSSSVEEVHCAKAHWCRMSHDGRSRHLVA